MAHVVIVGAGPAGGALAYLLARRGIDVTLLERQFDFEREFRGEVLMPSGIAAFEQMGLLPDLDALPHRHFERVEVFRNGRPLLRFEPKQLGVGALPRVVFQPAVLEMLVERASRFPCFRFERGVRARNLLSENGRVVGVGVASREGERELLGDFVIGADGRASLLRKRAHLHEERMPQRFDVVWCKVPIPDSLEYGEAACFYIGRGHAAIVYPTYDEKLQIGWLIDKGAFGELRRRGVEEWLERLAQHVSPDLGAHLRKHRAAVTNPFLLDVICDRLVRWTAPGLLLVGDAAHPMSPVGGQGINIALRDALVAANHLCPALEGAASPEDVDAAAVRIQSERLREVATIQRMQQIPPRLFFQSSRWSGLVLTLLPLLVQIGVARLLFRSGFRRIATGVTPVHLEV